MLRTREEIEAFVADIKARDNERNIHVKDLLVVVSTDNDGFQLMHKLDAEKGSGKVYKVTLNEVY